MKRSSELTPKNGIRWPARLLMSTLLCGSFYGLIGCGDQDVARDDADYIKLGLFARQYSDFSDEAKVSLVLMAMREINESGGLVLGGRNYLLDLEVAPFTDPGPETARAGFEDLVDEGVVGVVGPPSSSQLLGASDTQDGAWRSALDRSMVTISESASSSAISNLEDDGFVFRMLPPDSIQAHVGAREVYDSGDRKVALLYRGDSYGQSLADEFSESFSDLGGEVVADVAFDVSGEEVSDLDEYSFDAELDSVFEAGPDVVYLVAFNEIAQIGRRIVERDDIAGDDDVSFFGADSLYDPAVLQSVPPTVLERLRGTSSGVDSESEDYENFSRALHEEGVGEPWNASAQLYDAVYLFALAMQAADSSAPEEYKDFVGPVSRSDEDDVVVYVNDFERGREALLAGDGVNYEGASGPIEFDELGDPSAGLILIWSTEMETDDSYSFSIDKAVPF